MKKIVFYLCFTLLFSSTASADRWGGRSGQSFSAEARVIEYSPIIEDVYEPVEVCRDTYERVRSDRSRRVERDTGSLIVGGLLGGAAGSAIGKGSGRDAAAGVGAILGSQVASGDGDLSGGELIGGLAGGIIGNQIGKGSGKTAATAAGALIGSIIGGDIEEGNDYSRRGNDYAGVKKRKVRVCETNRELKKAIVGYTALLEYEGLQFETVLDKRPAGEYVDVLVNVEVLEER